MAYCGDQREELKHDRRHFDEETEKARVPLAGIFFGCPPSQGRSRRKRHACFSVFLVEVTTVVLQFLALVPAQYAMIAEGVHTERVYGQGSRPTSGAIFPNPLSADCPE